MVGAMHGSLEGPRSRREAADGVLSLPVLLLNRFFAPVAVIPARRAMTLLYAGAAHAIDDAGEAFDFSRWCALPVRRDDDGLGIVGGALRVPRVLHLHDYDRTPESTIRLTRRNLLLRDGYECQYCGARPGLRGLNVDHVVPRSRGGGDTWDNLVISCHGCNLKKGRLTPDEAGMRLARRPLRPRWTTTAHILLAARRPFREWQPFLHGH
jgi:5-methylcytosine-specific restriction endonuclease McrA